MAKIRLLLNSINIRVGELTQLEEGEYNYLINVMRRKIGDEVFIFNGRDGEFRAVISEVGKKKCWLRCGLQSRKQYFPPAITLAFALVKNVRIDFIAEKATELGVTAFQPLLTQHTITDKFNAERFCANIKEAVEQSGRLDFPELRPVIKLKNLFDSSKQSSKKPIFILCDESGQGQKAGDILGKIAPDSDSELIILIGPEGGFSEEEFVLMRNFPNLYALSLGPRILRADTATISAVTLIQEFLGDFKHPCNQEVFSNN